MKRLVPLILGLLVASCSRAAPEEFAVFFVRGLNSQASIPTAVVQAFAAEFPMVPVVTARIGDGSPEATRKGMYHQLDDIVQDAMSNPVLVGKRVIVIGGSQGGLLARAFIEKYAHVVPFTIDSFMSLAGPHDGQFGLPNSWEEQVDLIVWKGDAFLLNKIAQLLGIKNTPLKEPGYEGMTVEDAIAQLAQPAATRDIFDPLRSIIASIIKSLVRNDYPLVRIIFYNPLGQDLISVAGYWKDPQHRLDYLAFNQFLPFFNNEREHVDAARYKSNIQSLNRMILFWAGNDSVVKPDCSPAFRFYRWGSRTDLEQTFVETIQYQQNLLGLRDLYDNGRLFFECPPGMGHGCEGPAIPIAMNYLRVIVNQTPPSAIFEAVRQNDLGRVQALVTEDYTRLFKRDGFGQLPIYYAGNRLAIAQYLFAQALAQKRPLSVSEQGMLLFNAFGCGCLEVARWLIEDLHFNVAGIRSSLRSIATSNGQPHMVSYLDSVAFLTLQDAVMQNNYALVVQMVSANPCLVVQFIGDMYPLYFAGNKLEIAQYLFALHRQYGPLTLRELSQLLYYAFGSGSLPVAQWIIEGLYFDPTPYKSELLAIANTNGQYALVAYLNGFLASGRPTIHAAVINNNLDLVTKIAAVNPANVEQLDQQSMLPIYYAGNKLEVARYLYYQHVGLGRPLTNENLNTLLYYAFGAGSISVARFLLEEIKVQPTAVQSLVSIAQTNGQGQMLEYLGSLGLI